MRFSPMTNQTPALGHERAEKQVYATPRAPVLSAYTNYLFTNVEVVYTWEVEEFRLVHLGEYRPDQSIIEEWDSTNPLDDYLPSTHSENFFALSEAQEFQPQSMRNFFISQRIDTPVVLQQNRSKCRPSELLSHYRLAGMLSSHGSHRRTKLLLHSVLTSLVREILRPRLSEDAGIRYISEALFLLNRPRDVFVPVSEEDEEDEDDSPLGLDPLLPIEWRYGLYHTFGGLTSDEGFLTYVRIFELMAEHRPIFAMKTKKVDKMKFKHSRGKSGKYTIEWKYIPRYRRMDVVLRWLVDDIKFQKLPTFKARIARSIRTFLLSPNDHLVLRNRSYVHHNVYAKYKNTLLRSLKRVQ